MGTICLPGAIAAESSAPTSNRMKQVKKIGMQGFIIVFLQKCLVID
jgi:hypothetical protein